MESPNKKHLENPGGLDVLKAAKGEKEGLPFFYFADAKGKMLVTSCVDGPSTNVGCPVKPEEVEHFLKALKLSSKGWKPDELELVKKTFLAIK